MATVTVSAMLIAVATSPARAGIAVRSRPPRAVPGRRPGRALGRDPSPP